MDSRSIHQQVTDAIVAMLERGTLPWRRTWKTQGGTTNPVPANLITGRAYQGVNRVILWTSALAVGYPTHGWATFKQVHDAGGHVRKGERGTQVVLYRPVVTREPREPGQSDEQRQEEEREYVAHVLRVFTVFNAAQCEGLTTAMAPAAPPVNVVPAAELFIASVGAKVEHGGDRACYVPNADLIQLPSFAAFTSPEAYYATSLHEHVHWTGHCSRLNRLSQPAPYGSEQYAAEELVAELGAAFLCADLRIQGDLEHHASYLQEWLTILRQDKKAIFKAAAEANRAGDFLHARQPTCLEQAA